ncbi:2-hydroxyacid dehydrogenase [Paenibacillus sp. NPDC058071]|uniref:2-hydroxyacid dehydrogenase n=1 Tax=Paenibacillus sp. NPDC058071 TaxID=3346326 RepID=UPI0036D9DDFC
MTTRLKRICLLDSAIVLSEVEKARLYKGYEVEAFSPQNPSQSQLSRCDAMLVHSRISRDSLSKLAKCKYIGVRAHNTDYVDRQITEEMGIVVQGIPQLSQTSVVEHTFALIFAVSKQLKLSQNNISTGLWRGEMSPNYELSGKKLGIIGNGRIGKQVAMVGQALGMEVLIASKPGVEKPGEAPLMQVIQESDIVTLHLSSKENKVFFDREKIEGMKPGAILINTSRGSLLDYEALREKLLTKHLFGAGLDVFPEEPLNDPSLCDLPNVICTPHVAYYTQETISKMNSYLIDNLELFYKSEEERNK